jgi:hypothetical protein
MRSISSKLFAFILLYLSCSINSKELSDFKQLLEVSGLTYSKPTNLIELEAKKDKIISYEKALRDSNNYFEIRYVIRPISMLQIDYKDAHSTTPSPNHIFPLFFQTLINNLSDQSSSSTKEYLPSDANKFFNADWAAVALLNLNNEFSNQYQQLLMIAIHKDNASDAYLLILFNDYKYVKDHIDAITSSLVFK